MTNVAARFIALESLALGIPVIQPIAAGFYNLCCVVCLDSQGHSSGVKMLVNFCGKQELIELNWQIVLDEQTLKSYQDVNKTTDFGACTIALLLIRELSEYTTIEQSCTGTTIDYYLKPKAANDDTLIFNHTAYLEVSGIRRQTEKNNPNTRLREKQNRANTPADLPVLVAIVEFSQPHSVTVTL